MRLEPTRFIPGWFLLRQLHEPKFLCDKAIYKDLYLFISGTLQICRVVLKFWYESDT